ncbi:MAG TPA: gamma-glutamylcyclotransferase [Allosphingosinicella sp.]|jgi:gamma-glutamylcyclotransferase (GGCT)/AIG2-like uncharacterized protein YtfP
MARRGVHKNKDKRLNAEYKAQVEQRLSARAERKAIKQEQRRQAKREKKQKVEKRHLVGIYDHMRMGGRQHINLTADARYVGTYHTEPIYNLYGFEGDSYAGIKKNGNNSIVIEVYEISEDILEDLDSHNSYDGSQQDEQNLYLREKIKSPYGEILVYFYNNYVNMEAIPNGDWIDYIKTKVTIQPNNEKLLNKYAQHNLELKLKLDKVEKELEEEGEYGPIPTISYAEAMNTIFNKSHDIDRECMD